jgi:hypothetical protein
LLVFGNGAADRAKVRVAATPDEHHNFSAGFVLLHRAVRFHDVIEVENPTDMDTE